MSEQQGTHFWFMSFLQPTPNGFDTYRRSGHFNPPPGATRVDMFSVLRDEIERFTPELAGATVLAFDIQPNQL